MLSRKASSATAIGAKKNVDAERFSLDTNKNTNMTFAYVIGGNRKYVKDASLANP